MLLQVIVVWRYLPETKGKTLEELGEGHSKNKKHEMSMYSNTPTDMIICHMRITRPTDRSKSIGQASVS